MDTLSDLDTHSCCMQLYKSHSRIVPSARQIIAPKQQQFKFQPTVSDQRNDARCSVLKPCWRCKTAQTNAFPPAHARTQIIYLHRRERVHPRTTRKSVPLGVLRLRNFGWRKKYSSAAGHAMQSSVCVTHTHGALCHPLPAYQLHWRQSDLFLLRGSQRSSAKTN